MTPNRRAQRERELLADLERDERERVEWRAQLIEEFGDRGDCETAESKARRDAVSIIAEEEWQRYVASLTVEDYDEYYAAHPDEPFVECVEALFENAKEAEMSARIAVRVRAAGLEMFPGQYVLA